MDVVWIVGGTPDAPGRDELRYSIRSFTMNTEMTQAWVVGDVPDWFTGKAIPTKALPGKFDNQRQSIETFVNDPAAPAEFVLANDDMYATERVEGWPTYRNRNRASTWLAAEKAERRPNSWHRAVMATATWVSEVTETDPHIYEVHVPLRFDTRKLRDTIAAYPIGQPFAVGELYPLAGIGDEGVHVGNAKVKRHDSLDTKLAQDMPWLSGNPDTWKSSLGRYIKRLFPEPCEWEA